MRRENLPADELMGRRMETGVLAVLAQLARDAQLAPDQPRVGATPTSRRPSSASVEWAYFEERGRGRVPGWRSGPDRRGARARARSGSGTRRPSQRPPTKKSEIRKPSTAAIVTKRKPAWIPVDERLADDRR